MSSIPVTDPPLIPGNDEASVHRRALAREFFASALYVALVLLATLVAVPRDRLPSDHAVMASMIGTALGLILAHFVAFRYAAHFTAEAGRADTPLVQEALAGLAGGMSVALVASIPYVVFEGDDALLGALVVLGTLPAIMGGAIARLRGYSRTRSLGAAGMALIAASLVVYVKDFLGH
jgi:DMSO reductase anchor subunit